MANIAHQIQLFDGKFFDFLDPDSTPLSIEHIAHGLSHVCRFAGQIANADASYSVAQHSVLAAVHAPQEIRYDALMHDVSEAVLGDVSTPLKRLLPEYRRLEESVMESLSRQYAFMHGDPRVREIDLRMLATEQRDLLAIPQEDSTHWDFLPEPYFDRIECWEPHYAKQTFIGMFHALAPISISRRSRLQAA